MLRNREAVIEIRRDVFMRLNAVVYAVLSHRKGMPTPVVIRSRTDTGINVLLI